MVEFLLYAALLGFSVLYILPWLANSLFIPFAGKIPNSKWFPAIPARPVYATYGLVWTVLNILFWGGLLAGVFWVLMKVPVADKILREA